jgi:hypothetical protein
VDNTQNLPPSDDFDDSLNDWDDNFPPSDDFNGRTMEISMVALV